MSGFITCKMDNFEVLPTNRFGFDCNSAFGNVRLDNTWRDDWLVSVTKS